MRMKPPALVFCVVGLVAVSAPWNFDIPSVPSGRKRNLVGRSCKWWCRCYRCQRSPRVFLGQGLLIALCFEGYEVKGNPWLFTVPSTRQNLIIRGKGRVEDAVGRSQALEVS